MTFEVNIKHCALEYLNYWTSFDRKIWCALDSSQETKEYKATQLQRAANEYGVARTVRKIDEEKDEEKGKQEGKKERFSGVLDIIEKNSDIEINKNNRVEQIVKIENEIFEKYNKCKKGAGHPISFTTKMLWMKHRDPIIIYDSNACRALVFPKDGYKSDPQGYLQKYFDKWECEYKKKEPKIKEVCKLLKDIKAWTEGVHSLSDEEDEEIDKIVNSDWFRRRVFDFYLWKRGATV